MATLPPMTTSFPTEFVRGLPKAELHVHLEGTVDASTLLALCRKHGVTPPAETEAGIDEWYKFDDFPMFLERYFTVLGLLRSPEDFGFVAERYLDTAYAQGVQHVEFHVSATGHIVEKGKRWGPIHDGIVAGCKQAEQRTGMSWLLIPDISPHLPASDCAAAMEEVFAYDLTHVAAIGMGGPADTWWTDDFAPIFDRARAVGLETVSHAGEHGGADEVRFAIERFGATRIQHGIGAAQDPEVLALLVARDIACDICPGSNLALNAVASPEAHPLPDMLDAGVTVTIGTDDPPMFQTNLLDDYERAWNWAHLDRDAIAQLSRNSIECSFASDERKAELLRS